MERFIETEKMIQYAKHRPQREFPPFIPGIWINGKYFWLQNQSEKVFFEESLMIKIKQQQVHSKIRFFNIYVSNHGKEVKQIKLLGMYLPLNVEQNLLTFISPVENRIYHYANQHVFLMNAHYHGNGIKEYTTIQLWNAFTDRIWSSVKEGSLMYQPMSKGLAASIFAINMNVQPHETNKLCTWSINGSKKSELLTLERALFKNILAIPYEK
ncbi:hypothetical protein HPT25_25860 [Bacillus sp. BRMEA1]|uniref:hypothetical protein n=1 Tax=Neobacillus endophyticus TaxID=2738405 RepID=UPI001564D4C3|nr:hypothetical protein [Neobacillus endophyticus]NRD80758.1 hypothetical protein [Neobacillus endophyticus]